jgi:hypothetical protein
MLRDRSFTRVECGIAWTFSALTLGTGLVGLVLAVRNGNWRLGLAGMGVAAVGVLYALSAWRGRPFALNAPPPDADQPSD